MLYQKNMIIYVFRDKKLLRIIFIVNFDLQN
jgi:hypothetical protein